MTKQRGRKPGSRNGVYTVLRSREAAERLFHENVKLVGFAIRTMEIPVTDDALQDGYIGLWRAALAFDESQGKKFSGYAIQAIRGEIVRGWQKLNKFGLPPLSLDHLCLEDAPGDRSGAEDRPELHGAVCDRKAADRLETVEIDLWLQQLLGRTEMDVVRRRVSGETFPEINEAYGKPRGWAEVRFKRAKNTIKHDYEERMMNLG